jgi:hypothetical protein
LEAPLESINTKEQIEKIVVQIINARFQKAIEDYVREHGDVLKEISLYERLGMIETDFKDHREESGKTFETIDIKFELLINAMKQGFETSEKNLELINKQLEVFDKRFEASEKKSEAMDMKFEFLITAMKQGFESVDKRFEASERKFEAMDLKFELLISAMKQGFESVDKRFEASDKKSEAMDIKFESMIDSLKNINEALKINIDTVNKRMTGLQWMMGLLLGVPGLTLIIIKFIEVL